MKLKEIKWKLNRIEDEVNRLWVPHICTGLDNFLAMEEQLARIKESIETKQKKIMLKVAAKQA